jgi:hypothetical protein
MILQLEQIVLNYGKTPEGEKAKEMLNYLKSDISFQPTDNKGNVMVQNNVNNVNNPPQQPSSQPLNNNGVPQKPGSGQMMNPQQGQTQRLNNNRPQRKPNPNQQLQVESIPTKPQ